MPSGSKLEGSLGRGLTLRGFGGVSKTVQERWMEMNMSRLLTQNRGLIMRSGWKWSLAEEGRETIAKTHWALPGAQMRRR